MARFRLSLVALLAAGSGGACGQAGAQASAAAASGISAPAGWQVLPEMARAVGDAAKADGVTVAGTEAWGEPARGCYAVWIRLTGIGASVEQVLAGLASEKLETKDILKPTSEGNAADGLGIVALAFAKPPYAGRLRARIESGSISALACFANEREPIACETACSSLLGSLP